jgi:sugar phosphate permease
MTSQNGRPCRFGPDFVEAHLKRYGKRPSEARQLTYDIAVQDEYAPWRPWLDNQLAFLPDKVSDTITMSLSGRLADKIAARWIAIAGMIIVAAGAIVFTQIHVATSLALLAGALFVAGLGHGAVLPPAMGASYQGMPKPEIPAATATFNVVMRVGSSFGTAALAVVLQQAIRSRIPALFIPARHRAL